MPDKYPLANGNWSDAANWNDGTKPKAGDDVFADGKTVTIDEDATVASVRTTQRSGGTAGGGFTLNAGITLTADVIAGTTVCVAVSAAGDDFTITGNVTGGSGASSYGANNNSAGTLTITGNVTGGSGGSSYGAYNYLTGTLTIAGNATGGSGTSSHGAYNRSTGTLTITGNVTGGSGGSSFGVYTSTGTLTIAGNATGGSGASSYGAHNNSTGTLTITGNVTGGSGTNSYGANNYSTGTLTVSGLAIGSEFGNGSVGFELTAGVYGAQNGNTVVGGLKFGSRGLSPVNGNVFVDSFAAATCYVRKSDFTEGVLVDSASTNNPPATTDVRAGVSYTTGGVLTGTLAVPAAGSVALGVPVDAGVGTAVLTQAAVEAGTAAATLAIRNDIAAIDWTARALLSGTVGTVTSNSDFTLLSDDLSPTDNQYRGCWLTFETGNNVSVARFIGAYTGATKRVQFTGGGVGRGAFTSDVVAGDQWRLMPTTDLVAGIVGVRAS